MRPKTINVRAAVDNLGDLENVFAADGTDGAFAPDHGEEEYSAPNQAVPITRQSGISSKQQIGCLVWKRPRTLSLATPKAEDVRTSGPAFDRGDGPEAVGASSRAWTACREMPTLAGSEQTIVD